MTHPPIDQIIATAWAAERERYEIGYDLKTCMWQVWSKVSDAIPGDKPIFIPKPDDEWSEGRDEAFQYVDSLCATAVLTAIREAGIACVPVEPTEAAEEGGFDQEFWDSLLRGDHLNENFLKNAVRASYAKATPEEAARLDEWRQKAKEAAERVMAMLAAAPPLGER